jgi:hypothetical protein
MRIVPALDKLKHVSSGLISRAKSMPIQQLAFQCREEALTQRIVIGVPGGFHRRPHSGLTPPFAESQRRILTSLVRVVDHT